MYDVDPIAAPSFDQDGIERYQKFLQEKYKNNISLFNERYDLDIDDFKQLKPEDYWYSVIYGEGSCYTGEDIKKRTKKFWIWKDNMSWKIEELRLYFKDMQTRLKKDHPELFLCPDLSRGDIFLMCTARNNVTVTIRITVNCGILQCGGSICMRSVHMWIPAIS